MMKSSRALARKILCGLLAAGVVGVSGSALAAESKPNEAVIGEDKNVNTTYSDGKISGVYYGLKATGDASSSKEGKISLTTSKVEINATGIGIQGTNWGSVIVGNTDTQDVTISGVLQGVKLTKGSRAEITGNQVKISNESKRVLIEISNSMDKAKRPIQLSIKGKKIELKAATKIIEANSKYKRAESFPKASVILGDDYTELLDMKGGIGISAANNTEIIGNAKDINLVVNSTAKTYGMQATGEEAKVQLTSKDNLLIDVGGSGAIAVYSSSATSAKVNLAGNDVKIQAKGTDAPVYGVNSETGSNVSISGNTVEISTAGGKNDSYGKIGSSAIYADESNVKVDANKVVVNTDKAKENAYAVYGNCGSHITLGKDANSEVHISSSSEGNAMGVVVATASTSASTAAASQVRIQGAKINVAAEGGPKARSLYAQDQNEIIVGNAGSDIHISAKGEDAAGIIAIEHGSVALNGQNAVIDVDGSKYSTGIHVQNNDMTDETNRATVNVNTENTTINAVTALSAMSHSVLNVNSNLVTNGKNAILTRGNSDVNINTDGKHTTQLNGDIVFNYDGDSSGTGIDSNVNVNLNGEGSSWTGNTKAEWNSASGKPDEAKLTVSHMNLNVANGAQWNPTTINSQNNETNGMNNIAINNLALNNGVVNLDSNNFAGDNAVKIENLEGTGGTINTNNVDNNLSINSKAADTSLTVNGTKEVTDAIASGNAELQDLADVVKSNDKSAADSVTSDANDIIGGYS